MPRALVLLECTLFVKKLSEGHKTQWLEDQLSKSDLSGYQLLVMLKRWAEAIGESIRNAELMEKNVSGPGICVYSVCQVAIEEKMPLVFVYVALVHTHTCTRMCTVHVCVILVL